MGGGGMGVGVVVSALAVMLVPWLCAALVHLAWRPHAVARAFARQGIRGPPYRFFVGNTGEAKAMQAAASSETLAWNSHDITPRVMPHLRAWTALYGRVFLWWKGVTPMLCLGSYDMVRRVLSDKSGQYVKPEQNPAFMALMGRGLVFVEGEDWARHRRVVAPAFAIDRVRMTVGAMAACAGEVTQAWEARVQAAASGEVTVDVGHHFTELAADVISRSAFGTRYRRGREVFQAQRELLSMAVSGMNIVRDPWTQHVPTKANVRRWQLERKVRTMLVSIIDERLAAASSEAGGYGTDLLGVLLEAMARAANTGDCSSSQRVLNMGEIIDECKTFFFTGHETTSHLLTWAMFLLGTHLEWQQRLREEVLHECGGAEVPLHSDNMNKLKLVTMVLLETLRLYGPANIIERQATADVELCGVKVPKGTVLCIPFPMLHREQEVWGTDAGEFNPLRFRDGVGRAAAHPNALLAFSLGPRSCIGQDFAMLEAKATLAAILRRFAFEVAPEYVHVRAGQLYDHSAPARDAGHAQALGFIVVDTIEAKAAGLCSHFNQQKDSDSRLGGSYPPHPIFNPLAFATTPYLQSTGVRLAFRWLNFNNMIRDLLLHNVELDVNVLGTSHDLLL